MQVTEGCNANKMLSLECSGGLCIGTVELQHPLLLLNTMNEIHVSLILSFYLYIKQSLSLMLVAIH